MADGEDVGYKRPPKGGRFKPGTSGNPRGRPRGSADFKSDLAAEMRQRVTFCDQNGRQYTLTKQRALLRLLVASALKNEKGGISALLACIRYFGTDREDRATDAPEPEDLEMLKEYLARTEARLRHDADQPKHSTAPNKRKERK